jgi:hypothetical protein
MGDSRGSSWRRMTAAIGVVALGALAQAAPAGAHDVTAAIAPPAAVAVEDAQFAVGFAGDVTTLPNGEGYVEARIRSGVRTPCAATELADPGDPIIIAPPGARHVKGAFSLAGRYTADAPGEYLICVWIQDAFGASGPPTAATMTVRAPVLRLGASVPARVAPGAPFQVAVDYQAEVPRFLTVLVIHATRCPVTSRTLGAIFGQPAIVADNVEVSGPGSAARTLRLAKAGTYVVCGYLDKRFLGSSVAQLAVKAATVVVVAPFRSCASPGGRRHITAVRARGVSCVAARSLALRWGARRRAPRRLGAYRCFARSGRVTCTAGTAQVRFRFGAG